jgi:hypothetical protein
MKTYGSIRTSKRRQTVLAVAIASVLLSACGGGGGSNGTVPTPFTSWSAVSDGSTVVAPAMSQEVVQTTDPATGLVTGIGTPSAVDTAASSFTETVSRGGTITRVVITSPTGSVTYDTAMGDTIGYLAPAIDPTIRYAAKSNRSSYALAQDPSSFGWEYQSFGVWSTAPVAGTGNAGAMSTGAPTRGADIPTSGTATFTGKSIGFYTDAAGVGYAAFSDVSVNANFGARTLGLSSSGTSKTHDYITKSPASNLDLTGTLTYAAGTNSFTGNLTNTSGTALSGTSTGRFYGPSAQELGGVFTLKAGSGVETYGGAYGAKR